MRKLEDLQGGEFDWFAKDSAGQFALFATAGEGFIPTEAITLSETFERLADSIETPNWGSDGVWDDIAAHGLFVYDWRLHGGPYNRVREPALSSSGFGEQLRLIGAMPNFNGFFANTIQFASWPTGDS